MKIITTGQISLSNYQSFRNKQVHFYEPFFLRKYGQTKIQNITKFQTKEF
jgi:hypothetical protein